VRVEAPTHVVEFDYDVRGRRLRKRVLQQQELVRATSYVWANNTPLHEVDDLTGATRTYIRPDDGRWNQLGHVDVVGGRQVPTYYITGTAEQLDFAVDGEGKIVWRAEHAVYGDCSSVDATVDVAARAPNQFYDRDVELTYNYERWYDARLGVYISPDPLGLDGPLNARAYVDNPLWYIDPDGLGREPARRPSGAKSPPPGSGYPGPGKRPDRPKSPSDMGTEYMTRPGHYARDKDATTRKGAKVPGYVDCPNDQYTAAGDGFDDDIRRQVDEAGAAYGCHSCGSKNAGGPNWPKGEEQPPHFVPDHVPPNSTFPGMPKGSRKAGEVPHPPRKGSVALYPQCRTCSNASGPMIGRMSKSEKARTYRENVAANRAQNRGRAAR